MVMIDGHLMADPGNKSGAHILTLPRGRDSEPDTRILILLPLPIPLKLNLHTPLRVGPDFLTGRPHNDPFFSAHARLHDTARKAEGFICWLDFKFRFTTVGLPRTRLVAHVLDIKRTGHHQIFTVRRPLRVAGQRECVTDG